MLGSPELSLDLGTLPRRPAVYYPFSGIVFRELADAGELRIRMYTMVGYESNASLAANLARYRIVGYANDFLTVRSIKRMADSALASYTSNNAWAAFEEDLKGSLVPGMLADFVALSHDIHECRMQSCCRRAYYTQCSAVASSTAAMRTEMPVFGLTLAAPVSSGIPVAGASENRLA
jgi:hypothetical protein